MQYQYHPNPLNNQEIKLLHYTVSVEDLTVTVAEDELPIFTCNNILPPLMVVVKVPNISPVAIAHCSTIVAVVPSWINPY